ncbi:kinase-like domain-containing protein [Paraphysoderma sedebokerense]|nr:kinase-like domain-containing protein [Paraphysoderma sedebokerense]
MEIRDPNSVQFHTKYQIVYPLYSRYNDDTVGVDFATHTEAYGSTRTFAVKFVHSVRGARRDDLMNLQREIALLKTLKPNPYCIQYHGSYLTEAVDEILVRMVMDAAIGSLEGYMRKCPLTGKELGIVANDITKAVKALHDEGFGHFELKEAGLVQRTMQKWDVWKLADFGSARRPDEVLEAYFLTEEYIERDPETGQARNIHSLAADMYALSIIFTNVANGADQSEKEKIGQLRSMAAKLQQPVEERPTIDNVINEFEFAGLIGSSVEWVRWFAYGEYCIEQQIRRFSLRGNTTFPCLIHFARQARLIQRYTAEAFRPGSISSSLMPHGAVVEHWNQRGVNPTTEQHLIIKLEVGKFGGDRVFAMRTEDAYRMLRLNKDQQNRLLSIAKKKTCQQCRYFMLSASRQRSKQFGDLANKLGLCFAPQSINGNTYVRLDRLFELYEVLGVQL